MAHRAGALAAADEVHSFVAISDTPISTPGTTPAKNSAAINTEPATCANTIMPIEGGMIGPIVAAVSTIAVAKRQAPRNGWPGHVGHGPVAGRKRPRGEGWLGAKGAHTSSARRAGREYGGPRQDNLEFGKLAELRIDLNRPAMLLKDDVVADG